MEARRGPLAWGQYLQWVAYRSATTLAVENLVSRCDIDIPAAASAALAKRALDRVVAVHEGLRTTFEMHDGTPRQTVHPMRDGGYRFVELPPEPDGSAPSARLAELLTEPFDLAAEWPLRAAVYPRPDGRLVLHLVLHRIMVDRAGATIVQKQVAEYLVDGVSGADDAVANTAWQPIDVARYERSTEGRRADAAAFEHWRMCLTEAPSSLFRTTRSTARSGAPEGGRFRVRRVSIQARDLVREVAAAFRVTEPMISMAAALLALSWAADCPYICATVVSANRSRQETRGSVSPLTDLGLVRVMAEPEQKFSAWALAVGTAALYAYRHCHADPNSVRRAVATVSTERGIYLHRFPILNVMSKPAVGSSACGSAVAGAEDQPDVQRTDVKPGPLDGLHIRIEIEPGALVVELIAGEQVLDIAAGERVVELVPAILWSVAEDGDMALGDLVEAAGIVPVGAADPGVVWLDHTRVDPDQVRALLLDCEGVHDCAVFVQPTAAGGRLDAFVVGGAAAQDIAGLRRAVARRLPEHRNVLCPHRFVVVAKPPGDRGSHAAWDALPVVAEGTSRPEDPVVPTCPREVHLAEAVAAANPGLTVDDIDLGLPYCLNNGRVEQIPVVLDRLAGYGIHGVAVDDLLGSQCLINLVGA